MDGFKCTVIIPSLNPDEKLMHTVTELEKYGFDDIIIVDDGSDKAYAANFPDVEEHPACTVIHHRVNRGKGAALKTAFGADDVYRIGGDEFVMVTGLDDVEKVTKIAKAVMEKNGAQTAYKGGTVPVSIRSGAVMIRKPLKYSMLCHDFDEVISFARNDGEVHFAKNQ